MDTILRLVNPQREAERRWVLAAVRGDAGHLFAAIQQENPYAAEARSRLLGSLESIHRKLLACDDDADGSLAIPGSPGVVP